LVSLITKTKLGVSPTTIIVSCHVFDQIMEVDVIMIRTMATHHYC
jgi:hypothetical protein